MTRRPPAVWVLTGLLVALAISAVLGGGSMMMDPSGSGLGMSPGLLEGTPFPDFRIPGWILFTLFGVGSLIVGHGVWHRARFPFLQRLNPVRGVHWGWTGAVALGAAHVTWILAQVAMIGYASLLQPLYAVVGATIALVPFVPSARAFLSVPSPDGGDA